MPAVSAGDNSELWRDPGPELWEPGQPPPGHPARVDQPAQYVPHAYGQTPWASPPLVPLPVAPPPVVPVPRRGKRMLRWAMGTLALVLVFSCACAGGLAGLVLATGGLAPTAEWVAAAPEAQLPASSAPLAEWQYWVGATVDESLRAQATALIKGDEAGFLAVVDPHNSTLLAEHKRRFKVLRAMSPGVWTETVNGAPSSIGGGRSWRVDLQISYCFGPPPCASVAIEVESKWSLVDNRLVMVDLASSDDDSTGPRPWETDDLTVATGKRTIVAATKSNAWRLEGAVEAADKAAAVADRFAKWSEPPSRYVIFLAGPSDWERWYGQEQPDWAAAWAVPVGDLVTEVVVRTEVVPQSVLQGLLTHELTHVTTLAGDRDGASGRAWWLIEGIAEYAQFKDVPVRSYDAFRSTRSFVGRRWNGEIAVSAPSSSASLSEAGGRYGVSYLAVRRIAEQYGEPKMLDFWGMVVHDGDSVDDASPSALGVAWDTVEADCARYIRSSVA